MVLMKSLLFVIVLVVIVFVVVVVWWCGGDVVGVVGVGVMIGICYGCVVNNFFFLCEVVDLLGSWGVIDVKIYDVIIDIVYVFVNLGIIFLVVILNWGVIIMVNS